ncbi:hypothetical protein [Arthrobacter castelli]|uniref:hypothetical protein n=1 Tax=Arthrobacter castelli TaxID=271431 RepID=UPI000422A5AE|nr:hypothetical protein [Arthrobacter castelli]
MWGDILTYLLPSLAVVGAVLAAAVHTSRGRRPLAAAAISFAAAYAALVLLVIVDSKILALAGYIPFVIFKAIFDPAALQGLQAGWPVVGHQLVLLLGTGLWVLTAAAAVRKAAGACIRCGRRHDGVGWFSAAKAWRWGTPVTIAAAVIPALYAIFRFAWAAGIPLGIEQKFLDSLHQSGGNYAALGLASMAALGTVLTFGLNQQWGAVFPRWVPAIGGRSVPVMLAVIPACFVALIVVPAGAEMVSAAAAGMTGAIPFDWNNWGTLAPALLWPAWGPLLAAAALAYYLKRRGGCARCGLNS